MSEKNLDGVFTDLLDDDDDDLLITKESERDAVEEPAEETVEEAVEEAGKNSEKSSEEESEEESGVKLFVPIKEGAKIENPDLAVDNNNDAKIGKNVEVLMKKLQNTEDDGQRAVLQKIIKSANANVKETPKVISIIEDAMTEKKQEDAKEPAKYEIEGMDATIPFIRRKIDYNSLDKMYREESKSFVQQYKANHKINVKKPVLISKDEVQRILDLPIFIAKNQEIKATNVITNGTKLPEDRVLSAMQKEFVEDTLFSYIIMHPYDTEISDYVVDEEDIEIMTVDSISGLE